MYLKRYHDIEVSKSGVWRILKRLDLNRLPSSQRYKRHDKRWKRYEKPLPRHRVQVDVNFIEPVGGSRKNHYQFTAIDEFIDYVFEKLPFRVEVIQTDNGAEFQAGFHRNVLGRGINHVYIKPATPRLNGKVGRSHRIDGVLPDA